MYICNNQFRTIKELGSSTPTIQRFLVEDLHNPERPNIILNIINIDNIETETISFLKDNFFIIKNQCNDCFLKNYEFEKVLNIDGNIINENLYLYSTEYIENSIALLDFLETATPNQMLEIITFIYKVLNLILNYKIVYTEILLKNIFIVKEKDQINIKVKDIISSKLEDPVHFRIISVADFKKFEYSNDILKAFLFSLLAKKQTNSISGRDIKELKNEYNKKGFSKTDKKIIQLIFEISSKLEKYKLIGQQYPIRQIIKDINKKLKTSFSILSTENHNFDKIFLTRPKEKTEVSLYFESLKKRAIKKNIFLVSGEFGTGKTNFLEEMKFLFLFEQATIYDIPSLRKFSDEEFILHIVKSLIMNTKSDRNISYEKDILECMDIVTDKRVPVDGVGKTVTTKYKLIYRIANLILERISSEFVIFIIDDIHFASDFIADLFSYLIIESTKNKNLIFISSYDEFAINQTEQGKKLKDLFNIQKNKIKIQLKNLSLQETHYMASCILNDKNIPEIIINKIYNHTGGNPFLINETIRKIISDGEIKKNKTTGEYNFTKHILDPAKILKITKSMEKVFYNQIQQISPEGITLLNAISTFKNSFTIEILAKLLNLNSDTINRNINNFVESGIIHKIIYKDKNDYTLENKIFQKILYQKLPLDYKLETHKKIFNHIKKIKEVDIKELLYHAEKADLKKLVIKYCIENKNEIKDAFPASEYTLLLEDLLSFIQKDDFNGEIQILLILAETYIQLGKGKKCLNKLNRAEKLIQKKDVHPKNIASTYIIKILYQIQIDSDNTEIQKTIKYTQQLVIKAKDKNTEARFLNAKVRHLQRESKFSEALKLSKKVVAHCGHSKNTQFEKTVALLNVGNCFYFMEQYSDAEKAYKQAIKLAEKIKDNIIKYNAYNNLAIIYKNYKNDFKSSMLCYNHIINNSEGFHSISIQVLAMINIAIENTCIGKYNEAYEYCLQAHKKLEHTALPLRALFTNVTAYEILAILCNFKAALAYQKKVNALLKGNPSFQKTLYSVEYNLSKAIILNYLGDYKKERNELNAAISCEEESIRKLFAKAILESNKLVSGETKDTTKLIEYYKSIFIKKKNFTTINTVYYYIINNLRKLIIKCPDIQINSILKQITTLNLFDVSENIEGGQLFLKAHLHKDQEEKYLIRAKKLLKNSYYLDLKIDISIKLGLYYLNQNNIKMTIIEFYEAQELIKKILKNIPEKNIPAFFNTNKYGIPFLTIENFLKNNLKLELPKEQNISYKKIREFISQDSISLLKTNKSFIDSLIQEEIKTSGIETKNLKEVITGFSNNFFKNIYKLTNFLSKHLLATSYDIIIKNFNSNIESIFEFEKNKTIKEITTTIQKNYGIEINSINKEGLIDNLIIPIKKHDRIQMEETIIAYLIFTSDKKLNNFNEFGIDLCKDLESVFSFLISTYILQQEASIDELTNTLTREYTEIALQELMANSTAPFAFLLYDLDKFKNVNDTFGHQIGDRVLQKTARKVKENLTEKQIIGRFGGEEFVVLLPETSKDEAIALAEKIRKDIENISFNIPNLKITISIGLSFFPENGNTAYELLLKADNALYNSKNTGRNRLTVWDEKNTPDIKLPSGFKGFISSNLEKDKLNIVALLNLISMVKNLDSKSKKIKLCVDKIIELSEADSGALIPIKNETTYKKTKHNNFTLNEKMIKEVLHNQRGIYAIDWENIAEKNKYTGIPSWNSIIIVPIIKIKKIKALVYLTVKTGKKEFTAEDFNMVKLLVKTIIPYF